MIEPIVLLACWVASLLVAALVLIAPLAAAGACDAKECDIDLIYQIANGPTPEWDVTPLDDCDESEIEYRAMLAWERKHCE